MRPKVTQTRWVVLVTILTTLFGAKEQVAGEDVAAEVDSIVRVVGGSRNPRRHYRRLEQLGAEAVPRLLHHLHRGEREEQVNTLLCLQFAWSKEAREPVRVLLNHRNGQIRKLAMIVLRRGEPPAQLAPLMAGHVDSSYPEVAVAALDAAEAAPDVQRMMRVMERAKLWSQTAKYLGRYYDLQLLEAARRVLRTGRINSRRDAVVALIHLQDDSPQTRMILMRLLASPNPSLREIAGEYFAWLGTGTDRDALLAAVAGDSDLHARASIGAAIEMIDRRGRIFPGEASARPPRLELAELTDPADLYKHAGTLLQDDRRQKIRRAVLEVLGKAEPFEPYWNFVSSIPSDDFAATRLARTKLVRSCFAFTPVDGDFEEQAGDAVESRGDPGAGQWVAPVRGFLGADRRSFGVLIKEGPMVGRIGGNHHVGDDSARDQPHATIVAAGQGVVKLVTAGGESWGGGVVIEHRGQDGSRFCSFYGHLGALICVRQGQLVRPGQKIGALGRNYTWENGGFRSHLHFGIHQGPYIPEYRIGQEVAIQVNGKEVKGKVIDLLESKVTLKVASQDSTIQFTPTADWIAEYLSSQTFKEGNHGWVSPQQFIRDRIE